MADASNVPVEEGVVTPPQGDPQGQGESQDAADVSNPSVVQSGIESGSGEPSTSQTTASAGKSPKGKQKERVRHKNLDKDSLVCGVCTAKGSGYHFGAITCESCKAFFRRWAGKEVEPCDNNCKMDPINRKFCQCCRLKKCFEIGMKKDWILDEETRAKRKKPVKKSAGSASNKPGTSSGQVLEPPSQAKLPAQPLTAEQQEEINEIFLKHSELDLGGNEQNADPNIRAGVKLLCTSDNEYQRLNTNPENPTQLLNMVQVFIIRFIPFMKSLRWYTQLQVEDRVYALKNSIMEIMAMRSAIQYNPDLGGFAVENTDSGERKSLQLEMIRHMFGEELYEAHVRFITSFNTAARYNKRTMILTMLIKIFDSNNLDVGSHDVMQQAQLHYSDLLRAHLRNEYPEESDEKIFARLLMINRDVVDYGEQSRKAIGPALVSSPELEPLLKELFSD